LRVRLNGDLPVILPCRKMAVNGSEISSHLFYSQRLSGMSDQSPAPLKTASSVAQWRKMSLNVAKNKMLSMF